MMTSAPAWDAAAIEKSVARLIAIRPAYRSILGFYGPVFIAQANAAQQTRPPEIQVDETLVAMKSEQGFAMIEPAAFGVDAAAAESLLTQIAGLAAASGEKLSRAGEALTRAMDEGAATTDLFVAALAQGDRLDDLAGQMAVDAVTAGTGFVDKVQFACSGDHFTTKFIQCVQIVADGAVGSY